MTNKSKHNKILIHCNVSATDYIELARTINEIARSTLKLDTRDASLLEAKVSLGLSLQAAELAGKGILRSLGHSVQDIRKKYGRHKILTLLREVEVQLQKSPENALQPYHRFLLRTPTINGEKFNTTIDSYLKDHMNQGPPAYPRNYFYPDESKFIGPTPVHSLLEMVDIIIDVANNIIDIVGPVQRKNKKRTSVSYTK